MAHITGEIVINRPPDVVFDYVADGRNEPRYNPSMRRVEQVSAGPIGLGTRFRAEVVSMGRAAEMTNEWIDFERPRRLGLRSRLASMDIHGHLTFDPVPGGTRMRWSWELEPRGVLKLLGPMIAFMGRRQERRIWSGLKRLLEAREAPSPVSDRGAPPRSPGAG